MYGRIVLPERSGNAPHYLSVTHYIVKTFVILLVPLLLHYTATWPEIH